MPDDPYISRTAVYRLFDAADQLLYVGIGPDPEARWYVHAREKSWWPLVARKAVSWHNTREAALAEETRSIESEWPLHNIRGGMVTHVEPRQQSTGVHISAQIARTRLADVLDQARTEGAVKITRHGQVAGVIVSPELYVELLAADVDDPELAAD